MGLLASSQQHLHWLIDPPCVLHMALFFFFDAPIYHGYLHRTCGLLFSLTEMEGADFSGPALMSGMKNQQQGCPELRGYTKEAGNRLCML